MAPRRNIAIAQMPFIPQDAVAALYSGVEAGCPRVQTGATTTTPRLIVELVTVNLDHTATDLCLLSLIALHSTGHHALGMLVWTALPMNFFWSL